MHSKHFLIIHSFTSVRRRNKRLLAVAIMDFSSSLLSDISLLVKVQYKKKMVWQIIIMKDQSDGQQKKD